MAESFQGFPRACLTFLRQLEKNNERDWFTPRKAEYEEKCRAPMEAFVAAVNARLAKTAVEYVVPEPKKAIYRIYRDTRFSKDKTPYKTHVAAYFQRKGYARHMGPGFYVQVSPKGLGIAGGIYMVEPEQMKAIRAEIARDPAHAVKLLSAKKLVAAVGEVKGDALKKTPPEFAALPEPAQLLARMKQWYYWHELPAEKALTREAVKLITDRIALMLPMCEWVHEVLTRASGDPEDRPKRPEPMF